jgi:hypothetical protein
MMDDGPDIDLDDDELLDEEETAQPQPGASGAQGKAGLPVDNAREILRVRLNDMMGIALDWHQLALDHPTIANDPDFPPAHHYAIKATTGIGKSEISRLEVASYYIPEARRRGLPHRVLILVPTHKLAGEARARMPVGITVAIWQGRDGIHLATGEPMCRNLHAVNAAIKIGADVQKTACRNKNARCPFFAECLYQEQKKAARNADVIFAAHEALFQVPKTLGKNFGLVIIDEGFWQKGLVGKNGEGFLLAIDRLDHELGEFPVRYKGVSEVESWTRDLRELIHQLQTALAHMPDGFVTRTPLIDAGLKPKHLLDDSSCKAAGKLEWQRKLKTVGLRPGLDEKAVKKLATKFGFLGQLRRRAAMWNKLDELIAGNEETSGQLRLETVTTEEGSVRQLRIMGRKKIAEGIAKMPIIHADATLQFDLTRHHLPSLELFGEIKVAAPHMRITQVIGLPVGKASLKRGNRQKPGEEDRITRKRQRLADVVRHVAQGRRGLIVTYKDIETDFAGIENVETGHFGAVEGIDRWSNVEVAFIIGRPLPSPKAVAKLAASISGKPVEVSDMVERNHTIHLTDGTEHTITCRVCEDPDAEMVRQAITYAAIEQAIGRVRGINRTANNPVEVYLIIHDVVAPNIEIDEVVEFGDLEPGAIDHMIDRGLILQMPTDASKVWKDLFPSRSAAKMAYRRAGLSIRKCPPGPGPRVRLVTSPGISISTRRCDQPPWAALAFQSRGRGQVPRLALVNLLKFPDPRAVLVAALGPLVKFEIVKEEGQELAAE